MRTSLDKSRAQERKGAALHGGSVNSGSGNGTWRKNDVRTEDLSLEYKYTDKKSYSLKVDDLLKAETHAILDGREMVFGISFAGEDFVVMRETYFAELRNR